MDTTRNKCGVSYDIVNGPNKDQLFDACKYAYSNTASITVSFDVALGYTMPKDDPGCAYISLPISDIRIASIEHEDGSGESLNIRGYCKADTDIKSDNKYKPYKFEAYYNTKKRSGFIILT